MINNRLGRIFCEANNPSKNYATTILQSIASLEITRNLFLNQNNYYMNQTLITNEFRNIVNSVYSSANDISAMNLINNLNNYALSKNQDLNLCNSPYTFLYYFLEMLDKEYNNAFQININLEQKFPSIENASYFFKQQYETSNISIILKNYCFSVIMTNFCNACKSSISKPVFKKTIDLNIDSYLQMNNLQPLTLSDCLKYYFIPKQVSVNCQNCSNSNLFQSRIILKTGPVLIFNLMRNNYTGEKDPNFIIDYNLDLSPYKKDKNDGNNTYTLKSCLSCSPLGFFTDCLIKNNSEEKWYRYNDMREPNFLNREYIFSNQPVLLFYEASNNQNNNIINMNNNINQNMNYNNQINQQNLNMNQNNNFDIQNNQNNITNQNNEKIFDVISNFPLIYSIAFGEQIHNFEFNFEVNSNIINNPQSNLQMNSNFNNYQNQNNNNFGNISSQPNNQIEQINQNNINNMNDNMNNQNINNNNNNPNLNLNPLHFMLDIEDEKGETDLQYLNNENKENKEIVNNPLLNTNQNQEKNQNSNFQNNDSNMNISMQSNLNQNMNQNANININNEINQGLNKNEMPNFSSLNSNQNNSNNMLQNNSSNEIQEDFSSQNQNLQYNIMNNNFNNEMQQNLNVNMNMNIKNEQNKEIQPNFQQNDFMSKNINIASNDMSSNTNPQEEKKIEVPQLSSISLPQEENKNALNYNIKNSPQFIQNSFENQNKVVNEIPQNLMNPLNKNINFNQNNFNQIPQINIPQNFQKEINEIKKEEPKQIKKEMPKLEKKKEPIKIEKKIESNKIPESQPEKKKNIQERAKLFAGVIKPNPSQEGAAPKKKLNKDIIPKNEPKKEVKPKKIGGGQANNLFKAMLEKKGIFGAPRPDPPIMGMPHGPGGMMMNNNANRGQGPTIEQNTDLKKNLDKIPVVKKKKKSKINFGDEI